MLVEAVFTLAVCAVALPVCGALIYAFSQMVCQVVKEMRRTK